MCAEKSAFLRGEDLVIRCRTNHNHISIAVIVCIAILGLRSNRTVGIKSEAEIGCSCVPIFIGLNNS